MGGIVEQRDELSFAVVEYTPRYSPLRYESIVEFLQNEQRAGRLTFEE